MGKTCSGVSLDKISKAESRDFAQRTPNKRLSRKREPAETTALCGAKPAELLLSAICFCQRPNPGHDRVPADKVFCVELCCFETKVCLHRG